MGEAPMLASRIPTPCGFKSHPPQILLGPLACFNIRRSLFFSSSHGIQHALIELVTLLKSTAGPGDISHDKIHTGCGGAQIYCRLG